MPQSTETISSALGMKAVDGARLKAVAVGEAFGNEVADLAPSNRARRKITVT
jgi:hypothetical protein